MPEGQDDRDMSGNIVAVSVQSFWKEIRLSGHLGMGFCIISIRKEGWNVPSQKSASSSKDTIIMWQFSMLGKIVHEKNIWK